MNRCRAAVSVLAVAIAQAVPAMASAPEARPETHFENAVKWGAPDHIVTPDFPPSALKAKASGHVDVHGIVTAFGRLRDVRLEADRPESRDFERATAQTIGLWRFHPAQAEDCMPREIPVRVRLWFEFEKDRPKIFVSMPERRPRPAAAMKAVTKKPPEYPGVPLRRGEEALVYVRTEVAPDGSVIAVSARAMSPERQVGLVSFEREVMDALSQWTYTPAPEGHQRVRVSCTLVNFWIRD